MQKLLLKTLLRNQSEHDSTRFFTSPATSSEDDQDETTYHTGEASQPVTDGGEIREGEIIDDAPDFNRLRRNSFESTTSTAQTLVDENFETMSLATTLTPTMTVNSIHTGNQEFMDQRYGNTQQRKTMPINTILFKSGVSVYGSYQEAHTASNQPSSTGSSSKKNKQRERDTDQLEGKCEKIWPFVFAYTPTMMSFSKKRTPYMIIQKFNKIDGTKETYCTAYQQVIDQDRLKYTLEFSQPNPEYPTLTENEHITMITNGAKRITDTVYRGTRMRWYGTTGLSSTFGSGFFELRFLDKEDINPVTNNNNNNNRGSENFTQLPLSPTISSTSTSSAASDSYLESSQPPSHMIPVLNSNTAAASSSSHHHNNRQNNRLENTSVSRRPPVAVYYNISAKSLLTKKMRCVGEFSIWEPGYELADVITTMGLILRKQEQRKNNEATHSIKYFDSV